MQFVPAWCCTGLAPLPWLPALAVFPHARSYRVPKLEPQPGISLQGGAQQAGGQLGTGGSGGAGSGEAGAAVSRRRLAQHGSGVLTDDADVPWYCTEGAQALQVSPPPGTAVLFWWARQEQPVVRGSDAPSPRRQDTVAVAGC